MEVARNLSIVVENKEDEMWHCGICGFELFEDDDICPACGGHPVDENGDGK